MKIDTLNNFDLLNLYLELIEHKQVTYILQLALKEYIIIHGYRTEINYVCEVEHYTLKLNSVSDMFWNMYMTTPEDKTIFICEVRK